MATCFTMLRHMLKRGSPNQLYGRSFAVLHAANFHNKPFIDCDDVNKLNSSSASVHSPKRSHLPSLLPFNKESLQGFEIELMDPDLWRVSSVLAEAHKGKENLARTVDKESFERKMEEDNDFDDIDNMRLKGDLFYKLEKNSREFEEYNVSVHRKKSSKNKDRSTEMEFKTKKEDQHKQKSQSNSGKPSGSVLSSRANDTVVDDTKKRTRVPTYNQLTGPYHEPFCLDIYISKSSIRACIVHRVTSKVVVVAHSISKDMKFDLASTKDSLACGAVGGILARRAIEDDIHNVVYTPRKNEKVEGKLKIVLQSITDGGVDVKLKIKQRRPVKLPLLLMPWLRSSVLWEVQLSGRIVSSNFFSPRGESNPGRQSPWNVRAVIRLVESFFSPHGVMRSIILKHQFHRKTLEEKVLSSSSNLQTQSFLRKTVEHDLSMTEAFVCIQSADGKEATHS